MWCFSHKVDKLAIAIRMSKDFAPLKHFLMFLTEQWPNIGYNTWN